SQGFPEAATVAARIYRQSLFGVLQGRGDYARPVQSQIERFGTAARAEAKIALQSADPAAGFNDDDVEIEALEIVKRKVQAEETRARDAKWKPEGRGVLNEIQEAAAHRAGMLAVQEAFTKDFEENPEVESALASGNTAWIQSLARQNNRTLNQG